MLLLHSIKFIIVHKVLNMFPNPFDSPTELSVASNHLRQHSTADDSVIMWLCCWLSHDSNFMKTTGRLHPEWSGRGAGAASDQLRFWVQPSCDLHGIAVMWQPTTESHDDWLISSWMLMKVLRGHRKLHRKFERIQKGISNFTYY